MLAAHEHDVKLWTRRTEVAEAINRHRHNPGHLSEFELPERIEATTELGEALAGRELVIIAVPSQALREVMTLAGPHIAPGAIIVSAVKGIEYETGLTMHGVLEDVLDAEHHPRLVALSGPSFAREVANRQPTVVTLACREEVFAVAVQATLSCPWFRCYTQHDVIGVETAGALKNVIAIAIGMCDGMRAGQNARAALMTRGLAEITRRRARDLPRSGGHGRSPADLHRGPLAQSPSGAEAGRGAGPRRHRGRAGRSSGGNSHHSSCLPTRSAARGGAAHRRAGSLGHRRREDARGGGLGPDGQAAAQRAGPGKEMRIRSL
jgi:hypothetical protein